MAVDFLTDEQKAKYGRYWSDPDKTELARYFHLDETDKEFILKRRGTANQLGFALQLTSVRYLGGFINDLNNVPLNVLLFVEKQLSINSPEALKEYAKRETTKREHKALIRKQYDYHDFNDAAYSFRLSRLLYTRSWISNERPSLL